MFRKSTLAVLMMLGLMLPACGGGGSNAGDFCNSLVDHILSVCDINNAADAAMLGQFLAAMGEDDLTLEDLAADDGAAAKDSCEEGFDDDEEYDEDLQDAFLDTLEATTTCQDALVVASAMG